MLNTKEDTYFWKAMKEGDSDALSTLFRNHYPVLYDYGIKFCQHDELVKDTIQDVFTYIWEKRQSLAVVKSVRAYLVTTFRHTLLRSLNKIRQRENKLVEFGKYLDGTVFSPEEFIVFKEQKTSEMQVLREALNNIPPRIREALYLKTFDGFSYREISEIMQISPGVARNYVSEAFERLRIITSEMI